MVRQELAAGSSLKEAQARQFTREYLILCEALGAFDYAATSETIPILILDEADKLTDKIEDMLLQLLGAAGRMCRVSETSACVILRAGRL